jgi:hypothetical protein
MCEEGLSISNLKEVQKTSGLITYFENIEKDEK